MSAIPPYDPPKPTVEPFDIPQEPPALPQGESHQLPNSFFVAMSVPSHAPAPANDLPPEVLEQMRAPNEEQMQQIQTLYNEHDQELILAWWKHIYLRPSPHVTDKPIVCNVAHVLLHAKGMEKQTHGKRTQNHEPVAIPGTFAAAHMHWIRECSARKKWIDEKKEEWQRRRDAKAKWRAEIAVTEAQWDAYIEEARKLYKEADAYPIPERPIKA